MNHFLSALTLLTVLPVKTAPIKEGDTWQGGRALAFYPLVGLVIGALIVAGRFLFLLAFPPLVAAVLVIGLWAILTGGLHLDGFTDACDALFVPVSRERRLTILHDVHLGAFGAAGLALLLLTKSSATASVTSYWPIALAPVLGRWAMVCAAIYPLARQEGMAAMFRAGFTRRELVIATTICVVICLPAGVFGLLALVAAFATATLVAKLAMSRIGGLTGDMYGSICETVETVVLLLGTVALPVMYLAGR